MQAGRRGGPCAGHKRWWARARCGAARRRSKQRVDAPQPASTHLGDHRRVAAVRELHGVGDLPRVETNCSLVTTSQENKHIGLTAAACSARRCDARQCQHPCRPAADGRPQPARRQHPPARRPTHRGTPHWAPGSIPAGGAAGGRDQERCQASAAARLAGCSRSAAGTSAAADAAAVAVCCYCLRPCAARCLSIHGCSLAARLLQAAHRRPRAVAPAARAAARAAERAHARASQPAPASAPACLRAAA